MTFNKPILELLAKLDLFASSGLTKASLDVHVSVHRNITINDGQHVSGDVFAHHQEHVTVFTASGTVHRYCCRLVPWMRWNCKQFHLIHDSSRQQYRWTLPEAVNTATCS